MQRAQTGLKVKTIAKTYMQDRLLKVRNTKLNTNLIDMPALPDLGGFNSVRQSMNVQRAAPALQPARAFEVTAATSRRPIAITTSFQGPHDVPSLGPGSIKSPSNRQMIQEAKTKGQTENLLSSSGPADGASNGIDFLSTFQQAPDEVL